jgi:hypothetical protein
VQHHHHYKGDGVRGTAGPIDHHYDRSFPSFRPGWRRFCTGSHYSGSMAGMFFGRLSSHDVSSNAVLQEFAEDRTLADRITLASTSIDQMAALINSTTAEVNGIVCVIALPCFDEAESLYAELLGYCCNRLVTHGEL